MTITFVQIIQTVLLALVICLIFAWLASHLARQTGLMDWPRSAQHKTHRSPTPLAGGIALAATLAVCAPIAGILADTEITSILIAAVFVFAFGLIDDARSLRPVFKLAGQVGAAILLYSLGVSVGIFESPEFLIQIGQPWATYLNFAVTIMWLVGMTNAFNFVDSMDGLAVGLAAMSTAFFTFLALEDQQPLLSLQFAVLLGICAALYIFNSSPALIFLGDSGSQTLGFLLAALAIVYRPMGANQSSSWFAPILLLAVPIFDACLVVFSRLRRNRRIYQSALDHTYHRLLKLRLHPNRAVLLMQGAGFVLGNVALIAISLPPGQANTLFAFVILLGVVFYVTLDRRTFWT